jgi:hypothetical protein
MLGVGCWVLNVEGEGEGEGKGKGEGEAGCHWVVVEVVACV